MATRRPLTALAATVFSLALVAASGALATAAAVSPAVAPGNDNFGHAKAISALPFNRIVDVTDATLQASEPLDCDTSGHTVWYKFTAGFTGQLGIDTRGSTFAATVTAYTGASLATLSEQGCSDRVNGNDADLILNVDLGTSRPACIPTTRLATASMSTSSGSALRPMTR
jgi:hypothetical protein